METKEKRIFIKINNYHKVVLVFFFSIVIYLFAAIYNETFQHLMPMRSFLTWHTIFEFTSVLISFSLFTVTYFVYEESKSLKMIIFACVFLLMGSLDTFHTFSYKGMPHFFIANNTANRATTLWILSRVMGTLGIVAAISTPSKIVYTIKKEIIAGITFTFTIILFLIVTYFPNFFPPMFQEGIGLTNIKILIEYLIILILIISFIILTFQYKKTHSNKKYKFLIATILLIFSEFSFTSYGSIYDAYNYIGHIYKIIAFAIFYNALYVENVSTPIRELKNTKNKLKEYSDGLNFIVKQRTLELEELNQVLINDIEYAKEMQRCLLPYEMPKDMSVSFDAEYLAADHLSGDFYNVVKLDENNIAIYIGDVSGHGISAALLTVFAYQNVVQLKEYKDALTEQIIEPGMVLKTIYKSFNKTNINEEKYIVMLYGIYNIKERTFIYSSAGVNVSPYIIKESGDIYELNVKGFPICKLGDIISPYYENRSVQLDTGDKIFFYSDGLTEAKNSYGEIYGHNKLKDMIKNNLGSNSKELNAAIKNDFFKHIEYSNKLMDDVTFLTMTIN